MNILKLAFPLFLVLSMVTIVKTQMEYVFPDKYSTDFTNCAAIFFEDKMLVNEYSPEGKCLLGREKEGTITVSAVMLNELGATSITKLAFRVVIKNTKTNTLWMYNKEAAMEVELKDILEECQEGDNLYFMIEDKRYSLPHHEVELMWGC